MRSKSAHPSIKITITTSKAVSDNLALLVKVGLHGSSVADVAERLVCEGLRNLVKRKMAAVVDSPPILPMIKL